MQDSKSSHYSFGDGDLAAARLERLARAYAPSSATFLRATLPKDVQLGVDLGCGPGYTTELLAELSRAATVIGYERSPAYLGLARSRLPHLTFNEVDVLQPPYPNQDVDVFYSRFLLTHLHAPRVVLDACVQQLRPRGRLLLEETAQLSSPLAPLKHYYSLVAELQQQYGQELTIGQRLETLVHELPEAHATYNLTRIELAASTMAQLHAMNISTWKNDAYMQASHGRAALDDLEASLREIAAGAAPHSNVVCEMAQIVIERR
jgi:SAM-dependent methyltransferase